MKNFESIKNLVGSTLVEEDLKFIDFYCTQNFGLFIPVGGQCGYALKKNHTHPSYMIVIYFDKDVTGVNHYRAIAIAPGIPHNDEPDLHYYAMCIDKEYFEERWKLYDKNLPDFSQLNFSICSDILKTLNLFAFESSKQMLNSRITIAAQTEIITHWIIRSILGETLDMRAVSNDYSVARAQHYIEQHLSENITVKKLASLGYVSTSGLTHKFKAEIGVSPIEYLIEVRIRHAKNLLRRKNLSVTEIALQCGFSNTAHFSSTFQKREGISPKEFQQNSL